MSSLNVEVTGAGPDLVLLHGWGLNLRVWDSLVAAMSPRFRVIAVDLPGHGRSADVSASTPAERSWLVHQTLGSLSRRYSLLGWSLGGQIALDLAAAVPGQVERLVLVATTAKFAAAPDWAHGMAVEAISELARQLRVNSRLTVQDFLNLQARGSVRSEHVRAQLHRAISTQGHANPHALSRALESLAWSDLRASLSHVRAPSLVVSGQYDRITPPAASRALARALPNARYVELRRAAHAPFLSHENEFSALLERFLRPRARVRGKSKRAASKVRARGAKSSKRKAPSAKRARTRKRASRSRRLATRRARKPRSRRS
ncbi:MAG TPA: pimeloyl-ACP methyl ester esterase BioH [Steroidobacteraceae bacterium]|nr:pimeloyl-ACP methyl ester esterase BioH [Steroidobacteraceae bacterium]